MPYQLSRGGLLYGPYTLDDLKRHMATGNVLPNDLVKSEADADWITVDRLFAAGTPPPPPVAAVGSGFAVPAEWQVPYPGVAQPTAPEGTIYRLFPVSVPKFIVMSVCTLGLYHVYWAYKNWARIETEPGESLMPWARAIFLGIWNFSLFNRVHTRAAYEEIPTGWNPIFLGIVVLVFAGISRLPHGLGIISLLSFIPYLPVVGTIAKLNAKVASVTAEGPNDNFSGWNIAGIICGGLFAALAIVGSIGEITGTIHPK
jgi:hypothetical protein